MYEQAHWTLALRCVLQSDPATMRSQSSRPVASPEAKSGSAGKLLDTVPPQARKRPPAPALRGQPQPFRLQIRWRPEMDVGLADLPFRPFGATTAAIKQQNASASIA